MGRPKAILQSEFPYNITARCINREWFLLPMNQVWEIYCEELNETVISKKLVVHSFVLMSNHFHMIATTPQANISDCMHQFMTATSKRLTKAGNRINETYAGRHYKCILPNYYSYLNAYKYNYRNPVAASMCTHVEEYPYTSLYGLLYPKKKRILICDDPLLIFKESALHWLNTPPDPSKNEALRKGLRRTYFKSKKNRSDGSLIIGENEIL